VVGSKRLRAPLAAERHHVSQTGQCELCTCEVFSLKHREWHARVKRLLRVSGVKPRIAARGFHRLARAIEIDIKRGLHDWHLMQTYHMASLAEAAAGNHAASAATLARVAEHQKAALQYELRAYVSACAATALERAKAGEMDGAQAMVRGALPWGKLLRPPDHLLESARKLIEAWRKRQARLANQRVKPTAVSECGTIRGPRRRGIRAGR
jgi:hypothetical protein